MTHLTTIGIDIGGTKISSAVVLQGKIVSDVYKIMTPQNPHAILEAVFECINVHKSCIKNNVSCVGIATAGVVNVEKGQVTSATENLALGYAGINYTEQVLEKFGCFCFVDNDANAAAFAEYKYGASQGKSNAVMITFGTGIGAGIIINGSVYRGYRYFAGECGHMTIDLTDNRPCTCGGSGCWEAYAAGRGLEKTYVEILEQQKIDLSFTTCKEILEATAHQDPYALKAFKRWHEHICAGIINVIYTLSPEIVVLGGGLTKFINVDLVSKLVDRRIPFRVQLARAQFDNLSGIIGAAALAEYEYLLKGPPHNC